MMCGSYRARGGEDMRGGMDVLVETGVGARKVEWGMKPRWAKADARRMVNARGETLWEKPWFRAAASGKGRCGAWALWWYERRGKERWLVRDKEGEETLLAGVMEDGAAIITWDAGSLSWLHERAPVGMTGDAARSWLEGDEKEARAALEESALGRRWSAERVDGALF